MKVPVFKGSCTAIVTPYNDNGIDYEAFGRLIELQYEGGTDAILVCGTTGENATQSDKEHYELVEYCIKAVNGRMKVVVGVGSNNTMHAYEYAVHAKNAGADAILMITPYYNKTTQKGLVDHFFYVADRVDIPMIIYNVPSRTGVNVAPETYKKLSEHKNINGVKEASGNIAEFARARALCGDELVFWSGNDSDTLAIMAFGGQGIVSVASNIIPAEVKKLAELCFAGDFAVAAEQHFKLADFFDKLFVETNPIPLKTAMNLAGMKVGKMRLPLVEMSGANLETVKASMKQLGLPVG